MLAHAHCSEAYALPDNHLSRPRVSRRLATPCVPVVAHHDSNTVTFLHPQIQESPGKGLDIVVEFLIVPGEVVGAFHVARARAPVRARRLTPGNEGRTGAMFGQDLLCEVCRQRLRDKRGV